VQFPEFDPVLFSIGPLDIRWYALAYVGGIVLGWWYAAKLIRNTAIWAPGKPPLSTIQLDDLILWITLGIIFGGRFGYALFYKPELYGALFSGISWGDRLALFRLWDGGMSFHGGMIGTTLAVVIFAWRNKLATLSIGDMALAAAPFGLFFGRVAMCHAIPASSMKPVLRASPCSSSCGWRCSNGACWPSPAMSPASSCSDTGSPARRWRHSASLISGWRTCRSA